MTTKIYAILFVTLILNLLASSLKVSTKFSKYQGLGNDFILIDNTKSANLILTPEEGAKICDRNFGIGADGVIFALPGINGCDYTMRIYNSDGSEPQMCGNGIRCMAKFLLSEIESKTDSTEVSYNIWTNVGKIIPKLKNGEITVDMGEPILVPEKIPTLLSSTIDSKVVDAKVDILGHTYEITAVSMGNPHAVMFFKDLDNMPSPFTTLGPLVETHPSFPQKVNAHFVQVITSLAYCFIDHKILSRGHVRVKTWERGAGATLACGTGACSVVVAGVLTGRVDRSCLLSLPGGDLHVHWNDKDNKLYMTGPAERVFQGQL